MRSRWPASRCCSLRLRGAARASLRSAPAPSQLTQFYLVMSAGGALGGLFTALVAPLVFDWAWEHPLLVLAAARCCRCPLLPWDKWRRLPGSTRDGSRLCGCWSRSPLSWLAGRVTGPAWSNHWRAAAWLGTWHCVVIGLLLIAVALGCSWRCCDADARAQGRLGDGAAKRFDRRASAQLFRHLYVRDDYPGTTQAAHVWRTARRCTASSRPTRHRARADDLLRADQSGVGLALARPHPALYGPDARIGVVGLGPGRSPAIASPGSEWTFFEIDPVVVRYSRDPHLHLLSAVRRPDAGRARRCAAGTGEPCPGQLRCAGDRRLFVRRDPAAPDDRRRRSGSICGLLSPDGLLLIHISNRFIELEPVLAAAARAARLERRCALTTIPPRPRSLTSRSNLGRPVARSASADRGACAAPRPMRHGKPLARAPAPRAGPTTMPRSCPIIRWGRLLRSP
jgi:hypothetical protein